MKRLWLFALLFLLPAGTIPNAHAGNGSSPDPNWAALENSMKTMHQAMSRVGPSGNDDLDFVNLMLPHHEAAIEMAKAQLQYGSDPQMRRLAQEIITDQQSEIELMHLWQKEHGEHASGGKQ